MLPATILNELESAVSPGIFGRAVGHVHQFQLPSVFDYFNIGDTTVISSRIEDGFTIVTSEKRAAQIETCFPMQLAILLLVLYGESIFFGPGALAEIVTFLVAGNKMRFAGLPESFHATALEAVIRKGAAHAVRHGIEERIPSTYYLDLWSSTICDADWQIAGNTLCSGRTFLLHPAVVRWNFDLSRDQSLSHLLSPLSPAHPQSLHLSLLFLPMDFVDKGFCHMCVFEKNGADAPT